MITTAYAMFLACAKPTTLDDSAMFKALKSLFSSSNELKPDEYTVYTVHEGKEYVSHDGLGLKTSDPGVVPGSLAEPPEQHEPVQVAGTSEDSDFEPMTRHGGLFSDDMTDSHSSSLDSDSSFSESNSSLLDSESSMFEGGVNPATGLPMMDSAIDVGGNVFGMSDDSTGIGMDDSMGIGIGTDDLGVSAGSDIGIDSFSSFGDDFL